MTDRRHGSAFIQRAGLEDLDLLCPLFSRYRRFYQQEPEPGAEREYLSERLENGEAVVFLAMPEPSSDFASGFVLLYPTFDSVDLGSVWVLHDLYVNERDRRQGTARALMEAAHEYCRGKGAGRIDLETALTNSAAIPLYESMGYELDRRFHHFSLEL